MKHDFSSVETYIPYCTVQCFIKFLISLNESLSPDALLVSVCFKDNRLHDHVFCHLDTVYSQRLFSNVTEDK